MDKKAYPDILLERFLRASARASNGSYEIKHWMKVIAIPILSSQDKAVTIPASFSFIIEKKDSFASLEIRRKRISPRLMLLRMKLIEVSPQSDMRGFAAHKKENGRCPY